MFAALVSCADEFKVGDAFLEKAPSVDVDKDVVFNDANYARAFLWNAYTSLYYGRPLNWAQRGNRMGMGAVDALTDCFTSGLTWDGVNGLYYSVSLMLPLIIRRPFILILTVRISGPGFVKPGCL